MEIIYLEIYLTSNFLASPRILIAGSAHSLGAILGCLLSIPALDRLGRRGASLYVMSLAYIIGFILIGLATEPWVIIVGR